jgi:hypothetical protein
MLKMTLKDKQSNKIGVCMVTNDRDRGTIGVFFKASSLKNVYLIKTINVSVKVQFVVMF